MERSNFSGRTNYRNIREPGSAENISSHSPVGSLLFASLVVFFALQILLLFFLFFLKLSYDLSGVTTREVLPAVCDVVPSLGKL